MHVSVAFTDLDNDVNEVELYLDDNKIDSKNTGSSPYSYDWDTLNGSAKAANGVHHLKVVIRDQAGLQVSGYSTVTVSNKATTKAKKAFIPGFEGLLVLGALAGATITIGLRAKRNKP